MNIEGVEPTSSEVSFLAFDASLPGSQFQTTDVFGDIQGITETFAFRRTFSPVDISFYIKAGYSSINYFDEWYNQICGGSGSLNSNSIYKFNYPESYKKTIKIIKYEKDLREPSQRLNKGGTIASPLALTYILSEAYPVNVSAIPVSYEQSSVLRMSVTFNYTKYSIVQNARTT